MSERAPRQLHAPVGLLALLSSVSLAQVPTGIVTDLKDAVVSGAHVTASNLAQEISRTAVTNPYRGPMAGALLLILPAVAARRLDHG
jgi:hypothetical protein